MSHRDLPLRTAIVGFGVAGSIFHAPLVAADPAYRLEVIVTGDAERAAQARSRYPKARIVADFETLLATVDAGEITLDLVILATPPEGHRRQAEAIIARKLALVVDKPFAACLEDAKAITQAAQEAGTPLSVFHNRRWDGDFLTLSRLIANDALGRVRSFESRFTWWMPEGFGNWRDTTPVDQAGGLLFDLGSHLIDQALQLFGPVDSVHAELDRHSDSAGADEDAFVTLLHRSGVRSRLWMNGLAAQAGPRFHVLGSQAAFVKYGLDGQEAALARGASPLDDTYGIDDVQPILGAGNDLHQIEPARGDYPAYYSQLAKSLTEDAPLPVTAVEALDVLAIIETVHRHFAVRATSTPNSSATTTRKGQ
ncbi:Gfo/Idh/MocA family oxidoreductase [Halomonas sp. DN3]|uniref:Gfo/Idh/MocA family protein n=1 Tax=Halomonas sp. DN3 TaxID=2953657 RepID=UPI0020A04B52|nr:Gfo/Idh/MocA family oxidoreductase [Halomonas sp. DN3]USZ50416.1 Gfo/Idh/MocA family oxidoreductase [Halomonas sp. DN3]